MRRSARSRRPSSSATSKILMVKDWPHPRPLRGRDERWTRRSSSTSRTSSSRPATIRAHNDDKLHNHGSSTIQHGRGSVLTVDLTNRCNMMCDPCFMDANQVGFVHELSWEDIKTVLDNAISIKPRRQMSVQFSGGEPTISPYFLDAVRYAAQGRLATASRRRPTASSSPSALSSPRKRPKPACATPTSSSTASVTRPTHIVASVTCST